MTNSSGSSQCDPELPIPDIFWDMKTNLSYQAIGSERQIFSISVNKTRRDSGRSRITKVSNKYMKCGVLRKEVIGQNKKIPKLLIFVFDW